MGTVHFKTMAELRKGLEAYGRDAEAAVLRAARETAIYGRTAAMREGSRAKPKPYASGTYRGSWISGNTPKGSFVANTARHAIFVEEGRLPGKQPPLDAILEWVYLKRMLRRPKTSYKTARGTRRAAIRTRLHRNIIARAIARKIGREGIDGRFILKRAVPKINKRYIREIRKQMKALNKSPPKA